MYKLATNILPPNSILFIDNYFTELKLAGNLKAKRITVYRTIKPNRPDLLELLMKMKKLFLKDIPYGVLTIVV